ncbi:hypothetical protein QQM39_20505 [Streptomyces sp. DT2A-34]|uniref:hypothetical protein n=1 Tax=Streptomyces sp. DT2A-34 TaxID=3051182 RepID=UPI00265C15C6|nr:hypothetical protein [Streptomyces sp. DT2A-34]MDO0913145.1 hypothetical protein [Streptomyces sp. DT2A-34]
MTAVPVTISTGRPPVTRPALPTSVVATPTLVIEPNADTLSEGAACSCAAGDDNPN